MIDKFSADYQTKLNADLLAYLRGKRIAVVGNAEFSQELGDIIDAFDVVIRFNEFETKGYEKLVGVKTHIWAHTRYRQERPYRRDEPLDFRICPHWHGVTGDVKDYRLQEFEPPCVCCPKEIRYKLTRQCGRPSTGLSVVHWLLTLGLDFECFGFDHFKTTHYFSDGLTHGWHNPKAEAKWFRIFCQHRDEKRAADKTMLETEQTDTGALYAEFLEYLKDKRIAVVGNAKFRCQLGAAIDSFDVVIRFNNFKVKGYEAWVGSRTHIWAHCRNKEVKTREEPFAFRICSLPSDKTLASNHRDDHHTMACVYYPLKFYWSLREHLERPSTGLAIVYWLLEEGMNFQCFGFDHFKSTHYFDNVKNCYHYADQERKWFQTFCRWRDERLRLHA